MLDVKEIFVVYDVNEVDKSFIVGIFPREETANIFNLRYKHHKTKGNNNREYYTEIIRYDFPYDILKINEQRKRKPPVEYHW